MTRDWTIVTIGNLSRNRYWGDSEEKPVRPTLCTCTLIRCDAGAVLVDPSCQEAERMAAELDRTTGLRIGDIDAVFLTHEHGDHHYGLRHFPQAAWLASADAAAAINASGEYRKQVEPASGRILGSIDLLGTPGHTLGHHSLRFEAEGLSVLVSGDAVMTRDFWRERRPFFNAVDADRARRSMDEIADWAEAMVPGHGNWFLAR